MRTAGLAPGVGQQMWIRKRAVAGTIVPFGILRRLSFAWAVHVQSRDMGIVHPRGATTAAVHVRTPYWSVFQLAERKSLCDFARRPNQGTGSVAIPSARHDDNNGGRAGGCC